ncbi:hypothetical protein MMC07_000030 [Pseudocyphellaria aurata]|nr:hypothetical protein [Pseudocyphellaria aurata]
MAVTIVAVFNSTFGSALPSGAIVFMIPYFKITNEAQFELPISLFLVGYVLGPLFFAPLSETYGRKSILVSSFLLFTLFTLGCAVAPTWPLLLIFRFVAGVSASSPVAILGGLFADIYDDPTARGRANAFCMAATTMGPQLAPVVSGFVSTVSWRWSFWVALIVAGFSLSLLIFTPETYGPTILRHRARRLRKETGDLRIFAPIELEKKGTREMITVILMRPLRMLIFESIVLFTCLYLSLAYSIFYLFFVAYPLIFHGIYGMSTGVLGLAFLPIGLGAFIACGIFVCYDIVLRRAKKANAPWSSIEEYRRLPLACFGGSLYVVSLFWLGWTANSQIHWAVPLMAGLPFGIGFVLIFMALLNYLADAYEIFAASAMAASCLTRSVFGAVLPFAGLPMYRKLGIPWATSLLGFLSLAMTIVPFAFIKYGNRIRAGSKFCRELQERKQEMEEVRAQKESGADGNYKMSVTEKATEETQEIIPVV